MPAIDTIIKYLGSDNVAEFLDEEQQREIVLKVKQGYENDQDSCQHWLKTNLDAMKIVKCFEDESVDKNFPFPKSCKVIYPLLAPAIIQLASRLIQQISRNGKVAECVVLGEDPQGQKRDRAKRVSDYLSFELLVDSPTWLLEQHKLCHVMAAWGTAFKEVFYDPVLKKNVSELLSPEDVIIHQNTVSMETARRITLRRFLTSNDIIRQMRSGVFSSFEIEELQRGSETREEENENEETNPIHEVLKQFCYFDLDEDDYCEPYFIYVHLKSGKLLSIQPAFEYSDIELNSKNEIVNIQSRHNLVDYHLISDPEGKFFSLGLNHLLVHHNKSIIAILRQLIDAGTLANTQGGFVTKAFKTKEREINFKMGKFEVLETGPGIDIRQQVMQLPFKEPSQVLMGLLQMMIDTGEKIGFISDLLTGEVQGQNVPATTMLAMVEQGTRAFKPIIQKLFASEKKEFKIWFHLYNQYLDIPRYVKFHDSELVINKDDFDEDNLDIAPVADPTLSSEAHHYAKLQAMMQFAQTMPGAVNIQELAFRYFKDLNLPDPEKLVAPPQNNVDPKMVQMQMKAQLDSMKLELDKVRVQLEANKAQMENEKVNIKRQEVDIKAKESDDKQRKLTADAMKDVAEARNKDRMANIAQTKADTERERVELMKIQARNKPTSNG